MIDRPVNTVSQYSKIEQDLRNRILAGEFAENQPLPGELILSTEYGVSRKTVRKALENLRTQNYIRKHQGSGNFVIPAPERAKMPRCTGKICVLLPEDHHTNIFASELLAGIFKASSASGIRVFCRTHDTPASVLLEMYYNFECDGFIWGAISHTLPAALEELVRQKLPQIVVNWSVPGTGCVLYNSFDAWLVLLRAWKAAGYEKAVFADRQDASFWSCSRQQAFLQAAEGLGMACSVCTLLPGSVDLPPELLTELRQGAACIMASPFREKMLRIFQENALNPAWAEFTSDALESYPEATRIHIPVQKMGCEAVQLLSSTRFRDDPEPESIVNCFTVLGHSFCP